MFGEHAVYLHIGVMKTGTTALQSSVFPKCPELSYFGKPQLPLAHAIRSITTMGREEWVRAEPDTVAEIAAAFEGAGPRILLSEEEFSIGGEANSAADRSMIAARLQRLFPTATILVVVRNQFDALRSLHAYVMGMSSQYQPFGQWLEHHESVSVEGRGLDVFDYAKLVQLYAGLFPQRKIRVLRYEEMSTDYELFAERLAEALDLRPASLASIPIHRANVRPSHRRVKMVQWVRRNPWLIPLLGRMPQILSNRLEAFLDAGAPITSTYSAAERARVAARYGASNEWLSDYLGIDLGAHGYPVAHKPAFQAKALVRQGVEAFEEDAP